MTSQHLLQRGAGEDARQVLQPLVAEFTNLSRRFEGFGEREERLATRVKELLAFIDDFTQRCRLGIPHPSTTPPAASQPPPPAAPQSEQSADRA